MKFTLSWLKDHLETDAPVADIATAMTMAGLEVEHVTDPTAAMAPFTVARIVEAVPHPNADRLRVCQVDTVDGMKEIVCGAPNARAGLVTIYAPIGAWVPGLDVTLVEKPVRGVVSNGMLCSAAELELPGDSDGILDLDDGLKVGTPAAEVFGAEPVIDFEVTPNRPDWLGVAGIARDLSAAGLGPLKTPAIDPVPGTFASPVTVRIDSPDLCPVFAGRLIRGVSNGPSPEWLQARLTAIGLRPINRLVDITNLITYDRARPLHVYDAAKLVGGEIVVRGGQVATDTAEPEHLIALDGKTYTVDPAMCVIADAAGERPIGLGGVMGGELTGCSEDTTDVFLESAWFDPITTAQTGRTLGINSDAQYRFARGVDPASVVPGLELATRLILDLCGGEPSNVVVAGQAPADPVAFDFDPAYVQRLSGLSLGDDRIADILVALGFAVDRAKPWRVTPPSWRRDVEGPADLVEEVARIEGFDALPDTPLPDMARAAKGVLNPRQARVRVARRALAGLGYAEAVTWSFTRRAIAEMFGGGDERLVLENPIAADLDCMRPSILPNLIQAAARNADRGYPDVALFEIGPIYLGDGPDDQRTVIAGLIAPPSGPPLGRRGRGRPVRPQGGPAGPAGTDRGPGRRDAAESGPEPRLVAPRPFGPAATGAQDGDRRIRGSASAHTQGAGRRRSDAGLRDRAQFRTRAARQGRQGPRPGQPRQSDAPDPRLRLPGRGRYGVGRSGPGGHGCGQGPDRRGPGVRPVSWPRRARGQGLDGAGGGDPAARGDPDRGRNRRPVGENRGGGRKSRCHPADLSARGRGWTTAWQGSVNPGAASLP